MNSVADPSAKAASEPAADPATLDFYARNAATYVGARPAAISPDLLGFLPHLAAGAHVLELGCGSGLDAAAMEGMGFVVDATDATAAMVSIASQRLSRPARQLRFDELAAVAAYDAIVACASLLHVPAAALPLVLARIHTALKPGGWHFASFKTGSAPGWDAHGRYYNQLSQADAARIYGQAGAWRDLDFAEYDGVGYFSAPTRWLTVTARKSG
jgi:2-polyprenyl-3-methyl-5-hydroxy-6-metoxy-1,4-benzoquinol methylase